MNIALGYGPRYWNHGYLSQGLRWSHGEQDVLYRLALSNIEIDKAATILGRQPQTVVYRARDLCIKIPPDWGRVIYGEGTAKLLNLQYPFLVGKIDKESDIVIVNGLVPHGMPGREDACQDVLLALAESRTNIAELRRDPVLLKQFIRSFRRSSFERSGRGVDSLDVPNSYGESKLEFMDKRPILNGVDGIYFTYHDDFSDSVIEEISNEEEELGVPAAMWNSYAAVKATPGKESK